MTMAAIGARVAPSGPDINQIYERNQEATVYVGNLDYRTDEELLWELFTQVGPVKNVHIPRDKITGMHSNYGFVEFQLESDADYALKILNMIKVHGKPMRCNKAAQDKRTLEVGANLFIGNLDPDVDEALLYDTMSAFGNILSTKVMRDPETGEHRGFGFVSYDAFESSDAAVAAMNGQFLCDRPIHVSYAYKKNTKGERHGSAAERLLAGSRQTPLKDQQRQQAVLNNVMSSMLNTLVPPTGGVPSAGAGPTGTAVGAVPGGGIIPPLSLFTNPAVSLQRPSNISESNSVPLNPSVYFPLLGETPGGPGASASLPPDTTNIPANMPSMGAQGVPPVSAFQPGPNGLMQNPLLNMPPIPMPLLFGPMASGAVPPNMPPPPGFPMLMNNPLLGGQPNPLMGLHPSAPPSSMLGPNQSGPSQPWPGDPNLMWPPMYRP